ncbi:MAG: anti-sigma factor [Candidatus Nanopelagicales bacterium]
MSQADGTAAIPVGGHPDPADLALRALGERVGGDALDAHLATCVQCQTEVDQLAAVASTARSATPDDRPVDPPAHVWDAVRREVDADRAAVVSIDALRRQRRRTWIVGLAAASVGLVLGGVAVSALGIGGASAGDPVAGGASTSAAPAVVVASASLEPLPGSPAHGEAVVERDGNAETVRVDVTGLPAADGFYEVWLLSADAQRMIALGTLAPGVAATFSLPAGLSLDDFPVVDVSLEGWEGDPGHSGDSLVRGTLSV